MPFLRILLFIALGYYLLKILSRILSPLINNYIKRSVQKEFSKGYNNQYNKKKYKEGETSIDKQPKRPKSSKKVGEYIDFEEIDE